MECRIASRSAARNLVWLRNLCCSCGRSLCSHKWVANKTAPHCTSTHSGASFFFFRKAGNAVALASHSGKPGRPVSCVCFQREHRANLLRRVRCSRAPLRLLSDPKLSRSAPHVFCDSPVCLRRRHGSPVGCLWELRGSGCCLRAAGQCALFRRRRPKTFALREREGGGWKRGPSCRCGRRRRVKLLCQASLFSERALCDSGPRGTMAVMRL